MALAPVSIGAEVLVIDQGRILSDSLAGKDATSKLQALAIQKSRGFRPTAEALQAEQKSLEAQIKSLGPNQSQQNPELREHLDSFRKRSQSFQERSQRTERELEQTRQQSYNKLFEALQPLLKKVAQKKRAKLVMEKRATLFVHDSADVTTEVIAMLDKEKQTINVEWVSLEQPQGQPPRPTQAESPQAAPSLGSK